MSMDFLFCTSSRRNGIPLPEPRCWKPEGELMSTGFVFCGVFGDVRFFRRAKGDLNLLTMRAHFVFVALEGGEVVGVSGGESTTVVMIAGARFLRTLGLSEVPGSEELRQKLHLRRSAGSEGGGRAVMLEEGLEAASSWT
jgi:hypothetical protein